MSDRGRRNSNIQWIPVERQSQKMVALPTLNALSAILHEPPPDSAERVAPTGEGNEVSVPLEHHPSLGWVGGVARIEVDGQAPLGIARIGRTSFVGYLLADDILREVEVILNEAENRLQVRSIE